MRGIDAGSLDSFDLAILDILQQDNSTSQRIIGERVHLSAAAVNRRIQRMREAGVIVGNYSTLDPTKMGRPITVIVEVRIESERLDLLDAAKRSFQADPDVQQCYYVTGDADFVLIVTVPSMREYDALTRRLFFENHNVKKFRTLVVMERLKAGLAIPLHNA
ncbi:Lrp/AsnC family transcriptional regulator (plasmid) [Aminobacter sp. BA135]|uniref:Lrp/AsnC family transcriptional regulator n=1 Tax=Aminobacter sp. BA135 TaxID=537596 RepID=UPI003D7BD5ED